jgi:predicted ATPase
VSDDNEAVHGRLFEHTDTDDNIELDINLPDYSIAPTFVSIELTNFLSYKSATLDIGDFTAVIGPNASGKSNAVAAIKLLRDIPSYGLPIAIARRGGFDQLRHRSHGHPNDPALKLTFRYANASDSTYEIALAAVRGKRYRVKRESAALVLDNGERVSFVSDGEVVHYVDSRGRNRVRTRIGPGQSALTLGGMASYLVYNALLSMQAVEIHPAHVGELQDPSSTREFEPTGSNTASVYEALSLEAREAITEQLAVIVPGIVRIEPRNYADKQTLSFYQSTDHGNRSFSAKQMSDGTLRAFGILLALAQPLRPRLIVIEEPEVAIHLGALRSLVDMLQAEAERSQILLTTHSADIIDALPVDSLRVVWNDTDQSRIAGVSQHTRDILRKGMMSPGELLRADALDPEL